MQGIGALLSARISTVLVFACAIFCYWQRGCHPAASLWQKSVLLAHDQLSACPSAPGENSHHRGRLSLESGCTPNGCFTFAIPSHFEPLFRFGAAPLDADPFVWFSKERNVSCKN